jgi:hypothetical protein
MSHALYFDWWAPLLEAFTYTGLWPVLGRVLLFVALAALALGPLVYWLRMRPWRT